MVKLKNPKEEVTKVLKEWWNERKVLAYDFFTPSSQKEKFPKLLPAEIIIQIIKK